MSIVAAALVAGTRSEELLGGVWWRLQAIDSAQLVHAGGSVLLVARDIKAAPANPSPAEAEGMLQFADAVLIAGVTDAAPPGPDGKPGTWEPLQLVAGRAEEDPALNRVWVGSLALPLRRQLGEAILRIALDGGAAADRIARFLGGQQGAPG